MASYPILKDCSNENDKVYELPDGWSKRIIQRSSGASVGTWDAYLFPPADRNHKRLRSMVELMEFLLKNPDCPIDPRHVNMEKTPEVVMGSPDLLGSTTQKLYSFVEKLRNGEEINIEEFVKAKPKKESNGSASKSKTSGLKSKYCRKKMRPEKEAEEPLQIELTMLQALKLEKLFHTMADVPTPEQLIEWSKKLNLSYENVYAWFRIKWQARLEYEAAIQQLQINSGTTVNGGSTDSDEDADSRPTRPRQIKRFDVVLSFDPLVGQKGDPLFEIVNDNGEEDDVNEGDDESEVDVESSDASESDAQSEFEEHDIDIVENPVVI